MMISSAVHASSTIGRAAWPDSLIERVKRGGRVCCVLFAVTMAVFCVFFRSTVVKEINNWKTKVLEA